jgi:hypothetical protein
MGASILLGDDGREDITPIVVVLYIKEIVKTINK